MKEIGWEKLKRDYKFGTREGRGVLLVWQSIPVRHEPRAQVIAQGIEHFPEYFKDLTVLPEALEILDRYLETWGRPLALNACNLTVGSSHLGSLNPLVGAIMQQRPHYPVIPVFEDRIARVTRFGEPLTGATATAEDVRQSLYDLGEEVFRLRPAFQEHLGVACLRGLKKNWFTPVIVDGWQGGRELTGGRLLAASWVLANWIKRQVPEKRLGLLLPPGLGATVANLACVLADVTPVNLNFTAGRLANEAALKRGEITVLLTAEAMKAKVKDFPWPEKTIDLSKLVVGFSKFSLGWRWLAGTLLPRELLRRWIQVPREGGDREAVLLFTSGSVGEPKGVVLSHRNLIANVHQIDAVLSQGPIASLLACLPIFHSFGSTVTVWWPILGGPTAITYVSPTETAKLAELVEKYGIDLLLTTPTFLRNLLRKATPAQLRSVKIVVTGAEKLPLDLRADFETKFQVPVCEGFGMTEASPVVAVNLIEFDKLPGTPAYESPRRFGSVGRLVPGISFQVRHPETGQVLPFRETGMIWLRGANIFPGYLDDVTRTQEVLVDGWYATGDIGRLDEDGFLHVEGRLSRFSKIAGEMVPHGVVENKIMEIYRSQYGEAFTAVVVGVPDPTKGESLFALTSHHVGSSEARTKLAQTGLPNLWVPRDYLLVESIPMLPTGKLDIKGCQKLAQQASFKIA